MEHIVLLTAPADTCQAPVTVLEVHIDNDVSMRKSGYGEEAERYCVQGFTAMSIPQVVNVPMS